jgi:hypothetical protein
MRLLALLFLSVLPLCAEPKSLFISQLPPWQKMTRDSGMVFSGVVTQVRRSASSTGTTQITFRVENAIRGVRRGQVVTIREWSGLWNTGERYVNGERVLLFLYPKSKLGLTSPVGGRLGRYAVDAAGRVLVADPQSPRPRPVPVKIVKAQISKVVKE